LAGGRNQKILEDRTEMKAAAKILKRKVFPLRCFLRLGFRRQPLGQSNQLIPGTNGPSREQTNFGIAG
jgi:hypothetical protein